jgi:hypothetical protein
MTTEERIASLEERLAALESRPIVVGATKYGKLVTCPSHHDMIRLPSEDGGVIFCPDQVNQLSCSVMEVDLWYNCGVKNDKVKTLRLVNPRPGSSPKWKRPIHLILRELLEGCPEVRTVELIGYRRVIDAELKVVLLENSGVTFEFK